MRDKLWPYSMVATERPNENVNIIPYPKAMDEDKKAKANGSAPEWPANVCVRAQQGNGVPQFRIRSAA